ncbi:adenosylcobinamide-phosphate synthase CbiB [Mangrovicella endophytica]|uniref:adenosylcobinamide-phosphate synthase CbiB n=1 Tax=Mangrovicella endophytica TaxID=2066697 RepID=UPI000C9EADFE|nr:adenosylcobinamide-phosphate synthase CbiB [Mangrovicella endophytica]
MTGHIATLLIGSLLDRLIGDPPWLWRRLPHPVVLIGGAITSLERRGNRPALPFATRRRNGALAVALLLFGAILAGLALQALFAAALGRFAILPEAVILAVFLAQKSLLNHVAAVDAALRSGGLAAGRRTVSMIVGRDPEQLDEAGVCRAAIESLAENASDGIVAPWFWFLLAGLPGLFAYKALNTADSMIGHMNERYRAYGWAAARLDDAANLVPARLTALLIALVAGLERGATAGRYALAVARRDAPSHRSPNAGWPEAAMAGALGLSLGGPRRYGELEVSAPMLNPDGRREAEPADIAAALRLADGLFLALSTAVLVLCLGLLVTR